METNRCNYMERVLLMKDRHNRQNNNKGLENEAEKVLVAIYLTEKNLSRDRMLPLFKRKYFFKKSEIIILVLAVFIIHILVLCKI